MRNLSSSKPGELATRSSSAGMNQVTNQAHAKYKGLISTPGYCKFSAWKREIEIPKQPFSKLILSSLAAQNPERCWLKDQTTGRSETFGVGGRDSRRLARGLAQLGVGQGTVVCLWCSNYVEYWLLCLAVWDLGAVTLPTNCLTNTERLQHQLLETSAQVIVCDTYNVDQAIALKQEVASLKHVLLIGQQEELEGVVSVSSLLDTAPDIQLKEVKFDWDKSPVCLMYTTRNGESRIVKHTNKSLTAQVFSPKGSSNNWFDQNVGDCFLCGSWFFHFQGLLSFALSSMQGLTMFFLSEYSDTDLITALVDTKVPSAVLYPWQVRMLSQSSQLELHDLSQLKVIVTGGAVLGPTISKELQEKLPSIRFIRESYGLKETGLLTFNYPRYDKSGANSVPDDHLMPVGLPNMWTSFKIIDRITGSPVAGPDLQGELCVKTCQLSPGYLGEEESLLDNEGYFHTGDLGYYDKDGIIHFVEQISALISFWMYEISPSVLESRLLSHGSVADAAVVSIPDKENGQIPRGFVVLKSGHEETEENLINFLESRLQDHERLRGGLFYIQHIPRDENWKVVKSVLQAINPPSKYEDSADKVETPAQEKEPEPAQSPGTKRAVELAAQLLIPNDGKNQHQEAEEIFGMKSRSRRGSKENVLESETENMTSASDVKDEKVEDDDVEESDTEGEELQYWLPVLVSTSYIEKKVLAHPSVSEVVVKPVHIEGIGSIPRAYVTLKSGFSVPGEELASWCNSRLDWRHRLRGGFVIVQRIPRDSNGQIMINLEKFDRNVVAMRTFSDKEKFQQTGNKTTNI